LRATHDPRSDPRIIIHPHGYVKLFAGQDT